MPLKVNYLVFELKDTGYKPRLADPRVGYFLVDHQTYDDDSTQDNINRFILRWNFEKQDPKAKLSPPKKAFVWWLDNAIPVEYRDAIRDGILWWNKAFEKIGFKDAIVVKQMPDDADWDVGDMRYNVVRWITSPWQNGANAIALFRTNPITGEILNASINIDANWTRYVKMERGVLVDPAVQFADPDPFIAARAARDPRFCQMGKEGLNQAWWGDMALSMLSAANPKLDRKEYINAFLRELVAHEMGHNIGLRHNFIASCFRTLDELKDAKLVKESGTVASVMDYTPFNISALKVKGVDFFTPTIGPYDYWAVEYGYTPIDSKTVEGELWKLGQIASKCNLPGHLYQSDEMAIAGFDPAVTRYDLSSDPLAYWMKNLQISRYIVFNLSKRLPKKGESYWEFTRNLNRMLNMYAGAGRDVSRYIGGLHVNRNHKGDVGEKPTLAPIPVAQQKQALKMLNDYFLSENAFKFPAQYYGKLTGDPFPVDLISILLGGDFPILDTLSGLQRTVLNRGVFHPMTLRRIANNEFKVGDPSKAFTLPYLYHSVSASVWSEVDQKKPVSTLRRQLQRAYLDTMINQSLGATSVPDDARMLAWDQLRSLKDRLAAAKTAVAKDTYTRVHVDESLMRINRALDARQTISSGGGGGGSPLSMLFGQESKPAPPQIPAAITPSGVQPEIPAPLRLPRLPN